MTDTQFLKRSKELVQEDCDNKLNKVSVNDIRVVYYSYVLGNYKVMLYPMYTDLFYEVTWINDIKKFSIDCYKKQTHSTM